MAHPDEEVCILVTVTEKFHDFTKCFARHNKTAFSPVLDGFLTDGKPVTIDGDKADFSVFNFKQCPCMDRLCVVVCHSKQCLPNHAFQHRGGEADAFLTVDAGQFRVLIRWDSNDGEFCFATFNFCDLLFVSAESDLLPREAADNITEQLCTDYDAAPFFNFGGQFCCHSDFQIVTAKFYCCFFCCHQDAFQGWDGRF